MAHEKVYVVCEDMCMEEGMTKEEINSGLNGKSNTNHNHDSRYKLQGDFAVLTGSITLTNGSGSLTFDYPEGFNQNNCVPIAAGSEYSTNLNRIVFGFNKSSNLCIGASLNSSNIILSVAPFSGDVGPSGTYNYKIVLMKIS